MRFAGPPGIINTSATLSAVNSPSKAALLHHGQSSSVAVLQPGEGGMENLARVGGGEVALHDFADAVLRTIPPQCSREVVAGEYAYQPAVRRPPGNPAGSRPAHVRRPASRDRRGARHGSR